MARMGKGSEEYRTGYSREDMPQLAERTLAHPEGPGILVAGGELRQQ